MFTAKQKTICTLSFIALMTAPAALIASETLPSQADKKTIQGDQAHQHGHGHMHNKQDQRDEHNHGKKQGMMRGGGMGGMGGGMSGGSYAQLIASQADALALTDEQLGKITRIHIKDAAAFGKAKHQAKESMHDFMEASMKPATDDETIRKFGKKHNATFSDMIEQRINERKAVHAVLTADQMNKLKTLKMQDHHDHGGDHGGGHGGGHSH